MLGRSETERREEERVNYMKSGKLHSSPRMGLLFYIVVSLFCGTITDSARGELPPGLSPGVPNWDKKQNTGSRADELLPPLVSLPKGPPKCVTGIVGLCSKEIKPDTPGIDQTYTAMFQGQCNLAGESCVSLRSLCNEGSADQLRHSFNMILNKVTGEWCMVEPQNGTYRCLKPRGHKKPSDVDLCEFLKDAIKDPSLNFYSDNTCKCKLVGGIPEVGQIIMPETASYACAQNMKTLSECNTCCSTAGTGFFQDDDARAKWETDCTGSCKNYHRG